MIPNSISWWVFSSSDKVIVSSLLGLSATGLLSVAYKLSNIGIVIYNIFNMSLTESIALHINDEDINQYFNKIYDLIGNFFISFGTCIIAVLPIIFKILVNGNFIDSYELIPIAIIATEFQVFVGMFGTIYVAKNATKSIAITSTVAAIINIIVHLLLIPFIGIFAAVISTLVSYVVLFIYRYFDIQKRYFPISLNKQFIVNLIINVMVIAPLFYLKNIYTKLIIIIIAFTSTLLFNKKSIKVLEKIIKERVIK